MILIQGHLGKFEVTGRKSPKLEPGLYLSYVEELEVLTAHKYSETRF